MQWNWRVAGWVSLVVACGMVAQCRLWGANSIAQNSSAPGTQALPPELRGDLFMVRQQYVQAIESYQELPMNAVLWNKVGVAYHHLLAFNEAKKDYERALAMQPDYPEALNNLAAAYFAEHKYKKSVRLYREALKLQPRSAVMTANLGTAYFAEHKFSFGMEAYQTAFSLDPNVFASDSLATIPGALSLHERARQDFCLAELFAESGMRDRAIEYLRRALDEGFTDRSLILQDSVFAQLRKTPQFAQLASEEKLH